MKAVEFYKAFVSEIESALNSGDFDYEEHDLMDIYKTNEKLYTKIMNHKENGIIPRTIRKVFPEATVQNEYFRIDVIGWKSTYEKMKEEAKEKRVMLNAHRWDLLVAVEHENSKRDWSDEVMKLLHIKCPLKVIVGYNYCDQRQNGDREKLDFIAEQMQNIRAFHVGTDEEYLIILGNGCNKVTGESDYNAFDYRGYLYSWDRKRFERVEV